MKDITMNPFVRLLCLGQASELDPLDTVMGSYRGYDYALLNRGVQSSVGQVWIDGEISSNFGNDPHLIILKHTPNKSLFVYMKGLVKPQTFDLSLSQTPDSEQVETITNTLFFPQKVNDPKSEVWQMPAFNDIKVNEDWRVAINAQRKNHQLAELAGYVVDEVNGKDRSRYLSRHNLETNVHVNGPDLFLRLEHGLMVSNFRFTVQNRPFPIPLDKETELEVYGSINKVLKSAIL